MNAPTNKIQVLILSIGISILAHVLVLVSLGRFGEYRFFRPVDLMPVVIVEVTSLENMHTETTPNKSGVANHKIKNLQSVAAEGKQPEAPLYMPVDVGPSSKAVITEHAEPIRSFLTRDAPHHAVVSAVNPPLRSASEFLQTKTEKLSYMVSMLGVPVGSMELEAKNKDGEVFITLRTKSNAAMSNIYPVDDIIETRHIAGNFVITKVRKREGAFKSDIGFTIFLRDKRVFWIDNIRKRYSDETIPNSEVLDTLSAFYYLRNSELQVGKTEILHIYDGDVYAPVPVEVLSQEQLRLRNLKMVDTLLLRHVKQGNEKSERIGDVFIWLSNDENKVPVKFETTIPLGKVTVELISAATEKDNNIVTSVQP